MPVIDKVDNALANASNKKTLSQVFSTENGQRMLVKRSNMRQTAVT